VTAQDSTSLIGDILIVDDEVRNLQLLSQILSGAGYRVRAARGPQLAVDSALTQPPDLILLDVKMPEMDGFEVCRRLKQDDRTRDVPIIFVSALRNVQERIRGFEAGGVDFISKPFQEQEILARVRTHKALRDMTVHLEELVAKRTGELTAMNEALEAEVNERTQAEEEIRKNRDYLKRLTDSMADVVFSVKMPERVIEWTNDAVRQLGYDSEECIGRSTEFLYSDKEDFLTFGKNLKSAIAEGKDVFRMEALLQKKDGAVFPADIIVSFFRIEGEMVSATSIVRNIAERLEKEKRIQDYQDRLKALASDLTVTEERERRRIAEELHDGPVQALAFACMRLAPVKERVGSSEQARAIDEVSKCLRQAALDTNRIVSDLGSPSLRDLGLVAAISEWTTEQIRGRFGIETEVVSHLEEADGESLDDLTRTILFRNVRELLANVVKHAHATRVHVCLQRAGDRLEVVVRDDGQGCDPTQALKKVSSEGGFGLFSIRERMADLGGALEIDSELGRGFTATLVLPSTSAVGPRRRRHDEAKGSFGR
jgi:PAS domain S-box-containing protein